MFHYEVFTNHTAASFNKAIESFKVARFVDAVESCGSPPLVDSWRTNSPDLQTFLR